MRRLDGRTPQAGVNRLRAVRQHPDIARLAVGRVEAHGHIRVDRHGHTTRQHPITVGHGGAEQAYRERARPQAFGRPDWRGAKADFLLGHQPPAVQPDIGNEGLPLRLGELPGDPAERRPPGPRRALLSRADDQMVEPLDRLRVGGRIAKPAPRGVTQEQRLTQKLLAHIGQIAAEPAILHQCRTNGIGHQIRTLAANLGQPDRPQKTAGIQFQRVRLGALHAAHDEIERL